MMMKTALLLMALSMPMVLSEAEKNGKTCKQKRDYFLLGLETKVDECQECSKIKELKKNWDCHCHALGCKCPKPKNSCMLYGPEYIAPVVGYGKGKSSASSAAASSSSDGYYVYRYQKEEMADYGYEKGYGDDTHYYYEGYDQGGYSYGDDNHLCKFEHVKAYYEMGNTADANSDCEKYKSDYETTYKSYTAMKREHDKVVAEYSEYKKRYGEYTAMAQDEVENAEGIQTAAASASTGALMAILLPMAYWFN